MENVSVVHVSSEDEIFLATIAMSGTIIRKKRVPNSVKGIFV